MLVRREAVRIYTIGGHGAADDKYLAERFQVEEGGVGRGGAKGGCCAGAKWYGWGT